MTASRTQNVLRNFKFSLVFRVINLLSGFLLKTLFIYELGQEYVGIEGTFSNILSVLSLTELGIGAAIVYDLYAPLAHRNRYQITQLFHFYTKVYAAIGGTIFLLGLLLLPFLDVLITHVPNVEHLSVIYVLTSADPAVTYFFAQYASLLQADQKDSLVSKYNIVGNVIRLAIDAVVLIGFHNYILFLVCNIVIRTATNYAIARKTLVLYPYLRDKVESLPWARMRAIFGNAMSIFSIKFASVVQCSTDSMLISAMLSTLLAGSYAIYALIVASVQGIVYMIKVAVLPSVGNLCAETKDYAARRLVFARMQFVIAWCNAICVACLAVLLTPFVVLWAGEEYALSALAVGLIIFNYFMRGVQWPVETFFSADGLFPHFHKKPWVEAGLNVVLSIALCKVLDVAGVILGTTLAQMAATMWYDIYITNKYTLHGSLRRYWYETMKYTVATGVITLLCVYVCQQVVTPWPWMTWGAQAAACIVLAGGAFGVLFRKNEHYDYVRQMVVRKLSRH